MVSLLFVIIILITTSALDELSEWMCVVEPSLYCGLCQTTRRQRRHGGFGFRGEGDVVSDVSHVVAFRAILYR